MSTCENNNKPANSFDEEIKAILITAARSRERHFAVGQPWSGGNESFKEANIAHDMSMAFRQAGFFAFPEFPLPEQFRKSAKGAKKSLDAIFVRNDVVIICEWKVSTAKKGILWDKERMEKYAPLTLKSDFREHGFKDNARNVYLLCVCELWEEKELETWRGYFGGWNIDNFEFSRVKWRNELDDWLKEKEGRAYRWAWAWKKSEV